MGRGAWQATVLTGKKRKTQSDLADTITSLIVTSVPYWQDINNGRGGGGQCMAYVKSLYYFLNFFSVKLKLH